MRTIVLRIAYGNIAAYLYIFQIVTLLDVAEGFKAFPAGQIDFNDAPYRLFYLCSYRAVREKHHRFLAEPLFNNKEQGVGVFGQFNRERIVNNSDLPLFPILISDDDCFMGTGKCQNYVMTVVIILD